MKQDGDSTKALRQKKLTSPEFLEELREKEDFYYLRLSLFTSETGGRFSEHIVRDPVFKAIRHCYERTWQSRLLDMVKSHPESDFTESGIDSALAKAFQKLVEDPPDEWIEPCDPEQERIVANEFLQAAKHGNIARLNELVKFCEIIETRTFNVSKQHKRDFRPWPYYIASVARQFLEQGVLPDKKTVKEMAFLRRAADELPLLKVPVTQWKVSSVQKLNELYNLPEPRWKLFFRELGLKDLPSASTCPKR
jgi:hypothetical protein